MKFYRSGLSNLDTNVFLDLNITIVMKTYFQMKLADFPEAMTKFKLTLFCLEINRSILCLELFALDSFFQL